MAPPKTNASPAPGPSVKGARNRIAEALYDWCRNNHGYGHVFSQDELLDSDLIPDRNIHTLLPALQHLVLKSLFRIHDRLGNTIGWELIEPEKAKKYIRTIHHES